MIAMGRQAQKRKGAFDVDMTKPQPCVKAKEQTDADFAMKFAEEVQEVTEAMNMLSGYANELYDTKLRGWVRYDTDMVITSGHKRTESLWVKEAES